MVVYVSSRTCEEHCDQTEPWFQAKYGLRDYPKEWVAKWQSIESSDADLKNFHMPAPNLLLPTNFDLVDATESEGPLVPRLVGQSRTGNLWHLPDNMFSVPKAHACVYFLSPWIGEAPENRTAVGLFIKMLDFAMQVRRSAWCFKFARA